jgi:hypothetical protein
MADESETPTKQPLTAAEIDAVGTAFVAFLEEQPAGSRAEYRDGRWNFYRGPGGVARGLGKSLSHAVAAVNSTWGHDPETNQRREVSESGEVLPPE